MRGTHVVATALAVALAGAGCDGGGGGGEAPDPAAAPTFSPPGGAYETPQSVRIASTTPGATIHYTTDGTAPSRTSAIASGRVMVTAATTLRAIAVASGHTDSDVAAATYTITPRPPPVVTISSGEPSAIGLLASREITWESDQDGTFVVELRGDGTPGSGTVLSSGSVTAGVPVVQPVQGTQLTFGRPTPLHVHVTGGTGVLGTTSTSLSLKPRISIPIGGELGRIAVLPDGRKVYVARRSFDGLDDVAVIDGDPASATSFTVVRQVPVGVRPLGIAVTPDGSRVYVTNEGNGGAGGDSVSAISASSDTVLETVPLGAGSLPSGIAVTPDGKGAYVARRDGAVSLLDVDPTSPTYHEVIASVSEGLVLDVAIAITPDGKRAILNWSDGAGHGVDVIDVDPASASYHTILSSPVWSDGTMAGDVAVTGDGAFAYATDAAELLCRIDLETFTISARSAWAGPGFLALTPDGATLLTGHPGSQTLGVVRASDLSLVAEFPMGGLGLGFAGGIAITADGARAYVIRDPMSVDSQVVMVPLL